jgi:hypothetical protein
MGDKILNLFKLTLPLFEVQQGLKILTMTRLISWSSDLEVRQS